MYGNTKKRTRRKQQSAYIGFSTVSRSRIRPAGMRNATQAVCHSNVHCHFRAVSDFGLTYNHEQDIKVRDKTLLPATCAFLLTRWHLLIAEHAVSSNNSVAHVAALRLQGPFMG